MKKYLEFEKVIISNYKRGLMNFDEATHSIVGYLECMVDMGVIEEDRKYEEIRIATKKLLEV